MPVGNTYFTVQQEQDKWRNRVKLANITPVVANYGLNGAASIYNSN